MSLITQQKLADELNVRVGVLRQYLGRAEFAHIERVLINHRVVYKNVTKRDKERLKQFIYDAKRRVGNQK